MWHTYGHMDLYSKSYGLFSVCDTKIQRYAGGGKFRSAVNVVHSKIVGNFCRLVNNMHI